MVVSGLMIGGEERELEHSQHWELVEKQLSRRQSEVVRYLLREGGSAERETT